MMTPFRAARDLLTTIPGIGPLAAAVVISEAGAGIREFFPHAAHLASWAGMCPGNHESAGKRRSGKRRKGSQHLQPVLVECVWAAVRHPGREEQLVAQVEDLITALGEAHVELRVWKKSAEGRLAPLRTLR